MNSEAASEAQYEDSKSHFTNYRKDNRKIRLKCPILASANVIIDRSKIQEVLSDEQ